MSRARLICCLLLVACSGGNQANPAADGSMDAAPIDPVADGSAGGDGSSDSGTDQTTLEVGVAGGSLETSEGVRIEVPPDALTSTVVITVTTSPSVELGELVAVGPVFRFEPSELLFHRPVSVTLPYDQTAAGESEVAFYFTVVGNETQFLPIDVTSTAPGTVTAAVHHFSHGVVALAGPNCPTGQHDGGDGTCVVVGACSGGFSLMADGSCTGWVATTGFSPSGTPLLAYATTLLGDGRVLVSGGQVNEVTVADTHLLDPNSRTWTGGPAMPGPRVNHTATLLLDGRVLIVGGENDTAFLSSVEIYSPATGTFTSAAPMNTSRFGHSATALQDGRVLVVGGYDGDADQQLYDGWLYDPLADAWTSTLSSGQPFPSYHGAIRLADGSVLIIGWGGEHLVQRFVPGSPDAWQLLGPASATSESWDAIALDDGRVLVAGGIQGATLVDAAWLYNPTLDSWTMTTPMPGPMLRMSRYSAFLARLRNGRVLAPTFRASYAVDIFDPVTHGWTPGPDSMSCIPGATVQGLPGGRVLCVSSTPELFLQGT